MSAAWKRFLSCGLCGRDQALRNLREEQEHGTPMEFATQPHPQNGYYDNSYPDNRYPNNRMGGPLHVAMHEEDMFSEREANPTSATCTDISCAGFWMACVALAVLILVRVQDRADLRRLYHGIDWNGTVCGLGDRSSEPYVYWCAIGGEDMTDKEAAEMRREPSPSPAASDTIASSHTPVHNKDSAHASTSSTGSRTRAKSERSGVAESGSSAGASTGLHTPTPAPGGKSDTKDSAHASTSSTGSRSDAVSGSSAGASTGLHTPTPAPGGKSDTKASDTIASSHTPVHNKDGPSKGGRSGADGAKKATDTGIAHAPLPAPDLAHDSSKQRGSDANKAAFAEFSPAVDPSTGNVSADEKAHNAKGDGGEVKKAGDAGGKVSKDSVPRILGKLSTSSSTKAISSSSSSKKVQTRTVGSGGKATGDSKYLKATQHMHLKHPICVDSCPSSNRSVHQCLRGQDTILSHESVTGSFYKRTSYDFRWIQDYKTHELAQWYCIPQDPVMLKDVEGTMSHGLQPLVLHMSQVVKSYHPIIFAVVVAMVLGYAYLILSYFIARAVVYGAFFFASVLPIAAGLYLLFGSDIRRQVNTMDIGDHPEFVVFSTGSPQLDFGASVCLLLLGLAVASLACAMHQKIQLLLCTIDATVACIWDTPAMLIHPLWMIIPRILCAAAGCLGFAYLLSVGEVRVVHTMPYAARGMARTFEMGGLDKLGLVFFSLVAIWCMEVIKAFDEFVFGYAAQRWYSKPLSNKEMSPFVMFRGYFIGWMHVGSLAYGSFILTLLRPITDVLSLIYPRDADYSDSQTVSKCMALGMCCCLQCWMKVLRFLNRDAYLMVAVRSVGFCEGAEMAVNVLTGESTAARAVHGATRIFQVCGVVAITGGCCVATWLLCIYGKHTGEHVPGHILSGPAFVTLLAGAFALLVAMCFTMIFGIVAHTLLFSWALDGGRYRRDRQPRLPPDFERLLEDSQADNSNNSNNRQSGFMQSPRASSKDRPRSNNNMPYSNEARGLEAMSPRGGRRDSR